MGAKISNKIVKEDIEDISNRLSDISEDLNGKTFLIAGGAGFLGTYIVLTLDYLNKNLLKIPCKIIVIDNFITGLEESLEKNENIIIIKKDISNEEIDIEGPVDYIIHAASIASPVFYNKYPLETIDAGFKGTRNLLELARKKNVIAFKFFSSSEVYGDPHPNFIPTPEEYRGNVSCTGPRACYDESKRIGETICLTYADLYNVPVKISRTFNIYGPGIRIDDGRVIPNFVHSALKGEKIPIYGNGRNTRSFCYISDAIVGYFKILLSKHKKEIYNIGSDEQEISMKNLAELIQGIIGNENSTTFHTAGPNETYSEKSDPSRRCPDLTKIRTILGYKPEIPLVKGLRRFSKWMKEEIKDRERQGYLKECRICKNSVLKKFISLGETPLANNLLEKENEEEEHYPLELVYCDNCHLCQLSYVVDPKKMFIDYPYVTSTTDTFKSHFKKMAEELVSRLGIKNNSLIVDIGSNDGLLLKNFKEIGMDVVGIEPAKNIYQIAKNNGINTINDFMNKEVVDSIKKFKGKADLITANNVFAHINDIKSLTNNVKELLNDEGVFVIEVQYLFDTIKDLSFDNIYHEHLSYFCVLSLKKFFEMNNMEIFRVEHVDSHGGSIRVFTQKKQTGKHMIDVSVNNFIYKEKEAKLDKYDSYEKFAEKIYSNKMKIKEFIQKMKIGNKRIIGYGAPAKATTLLNFYGIDRNYISYVIEDNPLKHKKFIPGVKIPIRGKNPIINEQRPDYIIIFAWNFAKEIMEKNSSLKNEGVEFLTLSPQFKFL